MSPSRLIALALAASLLAIAFSRPVRRRPVARLPVTIHNTAFAISLALYGLPLIEYDELSTGAWVALTVGLAGFNVGCATRLLRTRRGTSVPAIDRPAPRSPVFSWLVPVLFGAGALYYAAALNSTFGLSALLSQPAYVRSRLGSAEYLAAYPVPIRALYGLGPLCLVCLALPKVSGVRLRRSVRGVGIVGTVALLSLSLGRTLLLLSVLWIGIAALLANEFSGQRVRLSPRRRRRIVFGGILCAVLLFQVIAVVLGKTGSTDDRLQRYVTEPLQGSPLTSAVVYLSATIPAFGHMVDLEAGASSRPVEVGEKVLDRDYIGPYWGAAQLSSIATLLHLAAPDDIRPFTSTPLPFNAYTYLDSLWLDGRLAAVGLGAFILGFGTTTLAARRPRTPRDLLGLSLLLALVCWSPFGNKFTDTFVVMSYLFLALDYLVRTQFVTGRRHHGPYVSAGVRAVARKNAARTPTPARSGDNDDEGVVPLAP